MSDHKYGKSFVRLLRGARSKIMSITPVLYLFIQTISPLKSCNNSVWKLWGVAEKTKRRSGAIKEDLLNWTEFGRLKINQD